MGTFGKYLAGIGAISREQLEEATDALVIVGGRLGTNLLELGHLDIEEVDRHLADYLGVPNPPPEWIESPSPAALESQLAALAKKYPVLPLEIEHGTLHLAMATPGQPDAMEEISFASGLHLEVYVLSEVHLALLRERHLRIPPPRRFSHFSLDRARRRSARAKKAREGSTPAASPEAEEASRQRELLGVGPLGQGEELTSDEAFSSLHSNWFERKPEPDGVEPAPPEPAVGARDAADVMRLEEQLATAPHREDVAALALRLARAYSSASALFVIHQGTVRGTASLDPDIALRIEGVLIPLETRSVFSQVAREGVAFRGPPPRDAIDAQLFRALGREGATEALILPIRLGERVVNVLYTDNGEHTIAATSAAALGALADSIARAYERIILDRKRRDC